MDTPDVIGTENSGILHYGDCLDVLHTLPDQCVDLIYLDPPFNSKRDYNAFFTSENGDSKAQITAFEDTWHWGEQSQNEFDGILHNPDSGAVGETLLPAIKTFLGNNDMMAYLTMMASRLLELRRVLKDTGSLYLHCDPTASHYLKILLDGVFGKNNFRNEIVWCYGSGGASKNRFSRKHDTIFFYTKTDKYNFEVDRVREKYNEKCDQPKIVNGKAYERKHPLGRIPFDWWQIPILTNTAKERLGYPTQKPLALLERIVKASSNPDDVVLDPFCGCGTAVHAAQKLGRKWIGIDITHLAVGLIKKRIHDAFPECKFEVKGTPQDVEAARYLATNNGLDGRYQFQYWALSLIDAIPANSKKKGADGGKDGFIWAYNSPTAEKPFKINISVKSGKIPANHIRELGGMIGQDNIEMCLLITLEEPSKNMRAEALTYGKYEYPNGKQFQRVQILTIQDLLDGKKPDFLDYGEGKAGLKKAAREQGKPQTQTEFR